jgi:nucleoside-diphosphate-sugar epimerase
MRIHFITGATGFVGRYLVNRLLEKGENVWILVRAKDGISGKNRTEKLFIDYFKKWPKTLRVVEGDITFENLGIDSNQIEELQNHEIILWHLAANLSFSSKEIAKVQETNYTGTVNTVNFANRLAKKFIHMSTAYVCGDLKKLKEDELDRHQKFRNHYEQSKFEAEKYVHNNCKIPYIIFRPSIIIGDSYSGKAENCTFGYYRFMFILYFLKRQIIKILSKNNAISTCLSFFGTKYCKENDILTIPILVFPYPKNKSVNLITIDYVIESMIQIYEKNLNNTTVHLVHNNPPKFNFMLESILFDLGYRNVKLFPIPAWLFKVLIQISYLTIFPIRKYMKSIKWYVPYFSEDYEFEMLTIEKHLKKPSEISREVVYNINKYAKEHILDNIEF